MGPSLSGLLDVVHGVEVAVGARELGGGDVVRRNPHVTIPVAVDPVHAGTGRTRDDGGVRSATRRNHLDHRSRPRRVNRWAVGNGVDVRARVPLVVIGRSRGEPSGLPRRRIHHSAHPFFARLAGELSVLGIRPIHDELVALTL